MRWHLYFSRLAVLCNIMFVVCLAITKIKNFVGHKDLNAIIIILGWFIAPILNMVLIVWWLSYLVQQKQILTPKALIFTNITFFIFQFLYLIIL